MLVRPQGYTQCVLVKILNKNTEFEHNFCLFTWASIDLTPVQLSVHTAYVNL